MTLLNYEDLSSIKKSVEVEIPADRISNEAQRVTTEFLATYYGGGVHERGAMGLGPAPVVIDVLARYAAAGVTDLCIRFIGNDQLAQLDRFTSEVLPALQ